MGLIRALVALYPAKWRAEFGDEFAALLEDTRLTPRAVLDVTLQAAKLQAAAHRRLVFAIAAALWSAGLEVLAVHDHLTANILWAPTAPARAIILAATVGPWLALGGAALANCINHNNGDRGATAAGSAS
jgi:hypothetical protein